MTLYTKLILMPLMVISPIMALSVSSYFTLWLILEFGTMMFMLMMIMDNNIFNKWEATFTYFMIQSLPSTMLIFLFMNMNTAYSFNSSFMINVILFIKMGITPFHSWVPWIMVKLSWNMCFFMTTIQKITPLIIMDSFIITKLNLFISFITVSVSSFMIMKMSSMKKIMAYSSISHSAWMIFILMINLPSLLIYFSIYSFITLIMFLMFHKINILTISDFNKLSTKLKWNQKISILSVIISMGGLPPFTGFTIKLLAIFTLKSSSIILTWMILMSLINMFTYMRFWSNLMFSFNSNSLNSFLMNSEPKFKSWFWIYLILSMSTFSLMSVITLY